MTATKTMKTTIVYMHDCSDIKFATCSTPKQNACMHTNISSRTKPHTHVGAKTCIQTHHLCKVMSVFTTKEKKNIYMYKTFFFQNPHL